jgi:S-adenosylmethionine:tRNA ribosyltransferase-isomerase
VSNPLRVTDFDYDLPAELIAQVPVPRRDRSRLLLLDRRTGSLQHRLFCDLVEFLTPSDLLVINEVKVFPARLLGRSERQRSVEVLLTREIDTDCWEALIQPSRKMRPGDRLQLADGAIEAHVLERRGEGAHLLRLAHDGVLSDLLWRVGQMPLPPYIKRRGVGCRDQGLGKDVGVPLYPKPSTLDPSLLDRERYQTVYAKHEGAIAAPTAGLHFTTELIDALKQRGIRFAPITLYVGPGTFRPVRTASVEDHRMEPEHYVIPEVTATAIKAARNDGRRVIAVGTTTVRALEHASTDGEVRAGAGTADLFIFPGYRFRIIDALITNFHLPRSTLLMLVSAFAGRDRILAAYREAIAQRYRFYSYGDAMLIA